MKISVQEHPDQLVVALSGEDCSAESMEEFKKVIQTALAREVVTPIVLDISQLFYLGSEGVGVIASAHKAMIERRSKVIVRNPTRQVARVFMVTRLDSYLHIQRDGAALEPVAARPKT